MVDRGFPEDEVQRERVEPAAGGRDASHQGGRSSDLGGRAHPSLS